MLCLLKIKFKENINLYKSIIGVVSKKMRENIQRWFRYEERIIGSSKNCIGNKYRKKEGKRKNENWGLNTILNDMRLANGEELSHARVM